MAASGSMSRDDKHTVAVSRQDDVLDKSKCGNESTSGGALKQGLSKAREVALEQADRERARLAEAQESEPAQTDLQREETDEIWEKVNCYKLHAM
mmetsp:Transcript_16192/g.29838  ORF Transcript_16192/g.29838 Transcript_16192/m.29838 type:complete len:95 (+) Transcript_16192:46-330(+)